VLPTRREFIFGSAALAACPPLPLVAAAPTAHNNLELWYDRPATKWTEALPLGNGRIGAMVYGGATPARIDLTESTIWSGAPSADNVNPTALESLPHIRQLMFDGNYAETRELCKKHLLGRPNSFGTHLPMASLLTTLGDDTEVTNYRRSLRLDQGIASVDYMQSGFKLRHEAFSSNPANVLVVHFVSDKPRSINGSIVFANLILPGKISTEANDTLVLDGNAFEHLHSNGKEGVRFVARIRALTDDGKISVGNDAIRIENASSLTLLVAIATNYRNPDPSDETRKNLADLNGVPYRQLRAVHIVDYQSLFHRVSVDLGGDSSFNRKPTDQRLNSLRAGVSDPGIAALFFQYGRYLTIAGSRQNSPLPLALQGIWNDGLASSMGWTDDFHLDINTQQNYWLAEVGNLSESQIPLFSFIDAMSVAGRSTASSMYGAPGWVAHVVTNPWGFTAPGWGLGWGIFPTGGLWLALQLWQHYQFMPDPLFLKDRVYPVFKQAAEFFLAYMARHPKNGWLVTGPAVSPENSFVAPSGIHSTESMGPTCDRVFVYALFRAIIEASTTLNVDEVFRTKVSAALAQLPPLQIGKHGQVQEWLEDFDEAEPGHRHMSHLTALYPENQISPTATPALAAAANVTIQRRITAPNWEDTEWSRANLVNFYARLLDSESAHKQLLGLIGKAAGDSLLTYSRAGVAGADSNIFSLDGNTAGAAGIAEMLLQSQGGELHLLPALPSAWPIGRITGLRARGGIEVSLQWANGELQQASLKPRFSGSHQLRYGAAAKQIQLVADRTLIVTARDFTHPAVSSAPKGEI
jgi:alpha-L-fucosidase 2